jgi:site-specific DNA-methyltransferase (adenine-specific)
MTTIMNDEILLGDFHNLALGLAPNSIDLIFTDPPYARVLATPCYRMLAEHAPRLLKDGGSLVTIVPHYLLGEVMETFKDRLKYRWIYSMDQEDGSHPRMAMGIEVCWKPMLHYVKRAYPQGKGFVRDKVPIPAPDKVLHGWQQAEAWSEYYVPRLTRPGDVVLDPFCGTGTVLLTCHRHERHYIGIDIDQEMVDKAQWRLAQAKAL